MKEINLTQGKVAIVDDGDFDWLSKWKWTYNQNGYAVRNVKQGHKQTRIYMHRAIMNAGRLKVDHKDGDTLNNQRQNLRLCSQSQNIQNSRKRTDNTSGHKGVTFHRASGKWAASICTNGRRLHLGLFDSIEDAVVCYQSAADKYHGEFACTS